MKEKINSAEKGFSEIAKSYWMARERRSRALMGANCLTQWFPALVELDIKVPKTKIVETDIELIKLLDGTKPEGWDGFLERMKETIKRMGLPCFLRTGQTSNKHSWGDTCYIDDIEKLPMHIFELTEFSFCATMIGLPVDVWVVRELLKTNPIFTAFHDMPITREFRYFVLNDIIVHRQPYWPPEAFEGYAKQENWKSLLKKMSILSKQEDDELTELSEKIGKLIGGCWSIDWLESEGKWYCIDMARGESSYIYQSNTEIKK